MTDSTRAWMESRGVVLFRVMGAVWIVSGGLVAAVTGPLDLEHGSWSAAFQVLVGGVVQTALGMAQDALAPQRPAASTLAAELLAWNVGGVVVIGGTLLGVPLIVDAGGLLLIAAVVLVIGTVGGWGKGPAWALWVYRVLAVVTVVSIPIGLVLAHLRAP